VTFASDLEGAVGLTRWETTLRSRNACRALREKSSIPLLAETVQSARAIRAGPSFVFTNFILAVRGGHSIF